MRFLCALIGHRWSYHGLWHQGDICARWWTRTRACGRCGYSETQSVIRPGKPLEIW